MQSLAIVSIYWCTVRAIHWSPAGALPEFNLAISGAKNDQDCILSFGRTRRRRRGITIQMSVDHIEPILNALAGASWPIYEQPYDAWYRVGENECGQREFLVQDPDGYLMRFAEPLGTRRPLRS